MEHLDCLVNNRIYENQSGDATQAHDFDIPRYNREGFYTTFLLQFGIYLHFYAFLKSSKCIRPFDTFWETH